MPEDDTINVDSPVTNTHYHQEKSSLGPLLAALLGAAIPGAGLAGYLLSQSPEPVVQPSNSDETVEIGLGRIDDYLQPESK